MKKVLSILLSLVMLLSIVSVVDFSAFAASNLTTGKCGENVSYSFDSSTGTLTISGTGNMYDYNYDGVDCSNPFYRNTDIKSVTIEKGVTSIGSSEFYDCTNLTSITIPDGVTSIGNSAFSGCTSLTSITIPDSVTSIGDGAFYICKSLKSITIPNSVTSIDIFAFEYCENLTDVYYNGTKAQWKSIGIYNDGNNYLTSAVIHCNDGITFKKKSITKDNVKYVLYDENSACVSGYLDNPKYVTISDNITYGGVEVPVTSINDSAFENCTNLISVTLSDNLTWIGENAFSNCERLICITIPNNVKSINRYTFYNCRSLKTITMPDSITSIGHYAFYNCTSLTDVYYGGTKEQWNKQWKVISIGSYNTNLTSAIIHCNDGSIFSGEITVTIDDLKYKLNSDNTASVVGYTGNPESVNISKTITYANETLIVTSIGSSAFEDCKSLASLTIPDSVTSIGDFAFYRCDNLKSIIIFNKECSLAESGLYRKTEILSFKDSRAIDYAKSNENPYSEIKCNDYGLEHSYESQILTKPTCKEKGLREFTCSRCSDKYTEEIESLGGEHNYKSEVLKEPTCTTKGTTRYTCTRCGDYYDKEDIGVLGHDYQSKVIKEPTCTTKGTTRYTCTRCGHSYDKEDIESLGEKHSYISKVIVQPTCESGGVIQYTCTKCNDTYTETIEPLGHDTKIIERVEPTLTEDGYYHLECQRDGCEYSNTHSIPQLTLDFNKNVEKKNSDYLSSYSDTYKIEMEQSGYLVFNFEGESEKWEINIYDEDYKKISTLKPVFKEFYKKSYLQKRLNSDIPNENQIVALLSGEYYVEINRISDSTNDNYSGNYKFSIDYQFANETISETKNDFYYDAPTAKDISLNKSYNGFLGATYAAMNYAGKDIITQDERDAYKIVIPQGSGLSRLNIYLSSKSFASLGSNCTLYLYNSEFELYEDFKPLTVELNCMASETVYLNEGVYYIAVTNSNSPIEYSFTTQFNPAGTYICVNHKYELKNVVNPTCETDGYNYYVCKICSTEYKEILPATGHTLVNDSAVSSTCISSGLTAGIHCSKCGAVIKEQIVLPKTSHNFAGNAQHCLNGCGVVNPNYVAPTQPSQPAQSSQPTNPAPAQTVKKPKLTSIKKAKGNKKAVALEWKKVSGVKGYEIQLATDKKFKKNKKSVNIKKQSTTKTTVKKLKAKTKYYVRIRTYKTVNGKKVYSSWSKAKTVKTK